MSESAQLFVRRPDPVPCAQVEADALPFGVSKSEVGALVLDTRLGQVPVKVGDWIVYTTPYEALSAAAFAEEFEPFVATADEAAEMIGGEGDE